MPRHNDAASWPWEATKQRTVDALERQSPSRAPSVDADVVVPLQQAMVCGAFGAVLVAVIASLLTTDAWLILLVTGAVGVAVAGAAWVLLLAEHRRLLWGDLERATRSDPDKAAPQELRVAISYYDQNGRFVKMEYLNIPGITAEQLKGFAHEVCTGMPLAVAAWVGEGAPFTRSQYDTLMAHLIRGGLVLDNRKQGRALTRVGWHVLRKIAELPPAPYPAPYADTKPPER